MTTIELKVQVTAFVSITLPDEVSLTQAEQRAQEIVFVLNKNTPPPEEVSKLIPNPDSWVVDLSTATNWEFDDAHHT